MRRINPYLAVFAVVYSFLFTLAVL